MLMNPVNGGMNLGYSTEAWTCQVSQKSRFSVSPPFLNYQWHRLDLCFFGLDLQTHFGIGTMAQRVRGLENELGSIQIFWLTRSIPSISRATQMFLGFI